MNSQVWNERYKTGDTPWENGSHHPEIERLFLAYVSKGEAVLEIGCGLGTNAEWLSQAGYSMTAIDVSLDAIQKAIKNSKDKHLTIDYKTLDFLIDWEQLPQYSTVFDCAFFHIMQEPEMQSDFAKKVAEVCYPGGYWINLSCSSDQAETISTASGVKSPPCLSAKEIVVAVEPFFEIIEMKRTFFAIDRGVQGKARFEAWGSVFRKR